MTDVPPPRPTSPRTDAPGLTNSSRTSQTSMWLVVLALAAVILAVIAFSVDRSSSVVDEAPTVPEATAPVETPDATETVPAEPAPDGEDATGTADTTEGTAGNTTGGTSTSP